MRPAIVPRDCAVASGCRRATGPATTCAQSVPAARSSSSAATFASGEQPHRFREREPVPFGGLLDFTEAVDHALQLFAIDLDPAAAHKCKSL